MKYCTYSVLYAHIFILWRHCAHIHCVSWTLRYAHVAVCNFRYILFDFWIGERYVRSEHIMFCHVLAYVQHPINLPYDHGLDATALMLFLLCYLCPRLFFYFIVYFFMCICITPDSKVHVAHMGPTWVLSATGRPHMGPMNLVIRDRTTS